MIGFAFDEVFLQHGDPGHPESRLRLDAIMERLGTTGWLERLAALPFSAATEEQLAWVHDPDYVAAVRSYSERGTSPEDPDTLANAATYTAATMAAGACIEAARRSVSGDLPCSFCAVRPPGHHALADRAMGFCFFNNAALAAEAALRAGLSRVAIVDTDVHHCNGTQDTFYHRSDVLVISLHEWGLYPGTGSVDEVGVEEGAGYTLNLPLEERTCDEHYLRAVEQVVLPALRAYQPELVVVSDGYDTHYSDLLARLNLTIGCYHAVAERLQEAADELASGRLVFVLEGGYDPDALGFGVENTLRALEGEEPLTQTAPEIHPRQRQRVEDALEYVIETHRARLGLS
jgi:acetoin utilization deacetylase AcuC-like enzyme